MSELNWYVGVDRGGQSHQVCVLGGAGEVRGRNAFAHSGPGLAAMASWIAETVGEASALRTDPHCLRRVEASAPIVVELREWTRMREELKRERVRLTNRMRE